MYYNKLMLNSLQNLINIVPIYKIQFFFEEIVIFIDPKNLFNLIFFFKKSFFISVFSINLYFGNRLSY